MATKKSASSNGATKSDTIRAVLAKHPTANVKAIKTSLAEQGVKASDALINKIKYTNGAAKGKKKKRGRRAASAHGSKAAAIRESWKRLGRNARNRDIVADLASKGVKVSSAQVSTLRKAAPGRGRAASAIASVETVSIAHLLAAKKLVAQLGGIEVARRALDDLSKLLAV